MCVQQRIIIVGPCQGTRDGLKRHICDSGFNHGQIQVYEAYTGTGGLHLFTQAAPISAVFVSLVLEDMSAGDFTQYLRQAKGFEGPIVWLHPPNAATAHIVEPFTAERVIQVLQQILPPFEEHTDGAFSG